GVVRGVLRSGGHSVIAVGPQRAVIALAVPRERLVVARGHAVGAAEDRLTAAVGDGDVDIRSAWNSELPCRGAVGQRSGAAVDDRGLADESQRLGRLGGLLQ